MNELGGRQRVQAHYEEPVTNWERTQARREIPRQPQPSVEANLQMQTGVTTILQSLQTKFSKT